MVKVLGSKAELSNPVTGHSIPLAGLHPGILWPRPIYNPGVYYGLGQFIPLRAYYTPVYKLSQAIIYPDII